MRIALDAMGGDYAPEQTVKGALEAVATSPGLEVLLCGPPDIIKAEIARHSSHPAGLTIIPAATTIAMGEPPAQAVRQKRDSSLMVGLELVKSGEADAFVSAGNTGAIMAGALITLGRMEGVDRPALGILLPGSNGHPALLLDAGANADCRPEWLVQFARMGSAFMSATAKTPSPRVALLNIGEEDSKGNQLALEAHALLRESGLNFQGNIEGKDVAHGLAEVVVTDGFTGNVVLKTAEGAAEFIFKELQSGLTAAPHLKLLAALLRPALRRIAHRVDFREYGGAPLLGVNGVVIIGHGRSNARAIASAHRMAADAAANDLVATIKGFAGTTIS
jgi:glycerol-3-phosphate acyltransferase PlsX